MPEPALKAIAQEVQVQKIEAHTSVKRPAVLASAASTVAVFAPLVAAVVYKDYIFHPYQKR